MVSRGSRIAVLLTLFLLLAVPTPLLARVDDSTSVPAVESQVVALLEKARAQRIFEEPLIPVGGSVAPDELTALSAAL